MSKRLARAISQGVVAVKNQSAGEVTVWFPLEDGTERRLSIPPYGSIELAPKFTTAKLLSRSRNLAGLLYRRTLSVI